MERQKCSGEEASYDRQTRLQQPRELGMQQNIALRGRLNFNMKVRERASRKLTYVMHMHVAGLCGPSWVLLLTNSVSSLATVVWITCMCVHVRSHPLDAQCPKLPDNNYLVEQVQNQYN